MVWIFRNKDKRERLTSFCYAGTEFALSIPSISSHKITLNEWAGFYVTSVNCSFQNDFAIGSKQVELNFRVT